MESKHFSHHHPLLFHQVPQGSQTHCSGCKSPASGIVYVCWQCSYFLHDQCYHAQRSLNQHPSHPVHPLSLLPFPTYPSASFFCNLCNLAGDGFSYSCSACDFDIHLHCALTPSPNPHLSQNYHNPQNPVYPPPPQPQHFPQPNPTPQNYAPPPLNPTPPIYSTVGNTTPSTAANPLIIKHFSHPHVLMQMEMDKKKAKVCSACEGELSGAAYCCTESYCTFNLHRSCFDSPREVKHKSHLQHPLTLLTKPPYNDGFTCNACLRNGKAFVYNCAVCSYDLHIDCIQCPDTVTRPDHSHNLTLCYSSPAVDQPFMCDVCKNPVHEMAWLYYCRQCDFGTHLDCVREVELKFSVLQLLTQEAILELWD
ncbi:hypothetical protein C2S53_017785 [Perilla frutescens var. hirtella]|uniref:DC1 domain-containing protein n=1 Tax=Perilla frutescens var. hirtella TaxID=608512 RepID=A0AAD4IXM0_PERFH|nr:hypothetical protein C2S51_025742 [Perilla frutescens var. frutescens]KAH6823312.1 hypothetical protein C2S53_017785 [Perilla frutescens var. hirtella]